MRKLIKGNLTKVYLVGLEGEVVGGAVTLNVSYRKNYELQVPAEESQQEGIINDTAPTGKDG